jgi:diaminopimelate epimerase
MNIEFEKWHGCQNDFILTKLRSTESHALAALKEKANLLCQRDANGIGADGLIVIEYDSLKIHIINSDGSIATTCGNGLRCATLFMLQDSDDTTIEFELINGTKTLCEKFGDSVLVNMGPYTSQAQWAENLHEPIEKILATHKLNHDGFDFVELANPHVVIRTQNFAQIKDVGEAIQAVVPGGINVHFMRSEPDTSSSMWPSAVAVNKEDAIKMVTYERGAGLTQACGSGACSTVVFEKNQGFLDPDAFIPVAMPGGAVIIKIYEDHVNMLGPACKVFIGSFEL